MPKKEFSEQENRYQKKVPDFNFSDLVSGKYSENLDMYINDHFIFRNFWLKLNSFVQLSTGKTENNGVYIGKEGYLFEKIKYTQNEKNNLQKAVKVINEFEQKNDIPIYFLLIPNSIYINKDKLPNNVEVYDQEQVIEEIYKSCSDDIKTIDVISTLKQNKDLALYFKTDHHMTSLGSYLVYKEFCKQINMNYTPISEFESNVISKDFLGTFDSKAQVVNQEKDIITVYKNDINENVKGNYDGTEYNSIFNEDYLDKKDKYSYFLNGNNAKVVIKTKVNNDRRLLVIKDSYAHILAQFLCQNYEEIHFIDPRYYNLQLSDYIRENSITETLFLYNIANLATDIGIRGVK